jgi:hypothetical protein
MLITDAVMIPGSLFEVTAEAENEFASIPQLIQPVWWPLRQRRNGQDGVEQLFTLLVVGVLGGEGQEGLDRSVTGVNNVIGSHSGHRSRVYRQCGGLGGRPGDRLSGARRTGRWQAMIATTISAALTKAAYSLGGSTGQYG